MINVRNVLANTNLFYVADREEYFEKLSVLYPLNEIA